MRAPGPAPPAPSRRPGWPDRAAAALFFVSFLHLPHEVPGTLLDQGWQELLTWSLGRDVVYGRDFVFTFGPLGFLRSYVYSPEWYALRCGFEVLQAAGFAALFTWHLRRLGGALERGLFVYVVCALVGASIDGGSFAAILALLVWALSGRQGHPAAVAVLVVALAWLGLAKFSYFALGLGCVAGATASLLAGRRWAGAATAALGWPAASVALWLLAGQPLGALPAWLAGSLEVAGEYGGAMGLPGRVPELWLSLGLAAVALLFVAAAWCRRPWCWEGLLLAATVAGWIAILWKSGFTRHDDIHAVGFFSAILIVPFLARGAEEPRALRPLALALVAVLFLTASSIGSPQFGDVRRFARGRPVSNWIAHAGDVARSLAPSRRAALDEALAAERRAHSLPAVREAVGDSPVDFFGYEPGWIFRNWLSFALRPTIQSYNAYSGMLQQLDAAWYAGPGAPAYSLVSLDAIDQRWPPGDFALAFEELRRRYEPVLTERSLLLVGRREEAAPSAPPTPLLARDLAWGEVLELPRDASALHLALEVRRSVWGSLRAAAWRTPIVWLELRIDGEWRRRRVVPSQASLPFLVSPALFETADLVDWARGGEVSRPDALRLGFEEGADAGFEPSVGVRLLRGAPDAFASGPRPGLEPLPRGDTGGS